MNFKPIYAEDFDIGDTFKKEIESAARVAGNKLVNDLRKPTKTWNDKPRIHSKKTFNSREITIEALIDESTEGGKHYVMLDQGVADHEIEATGVKYERKDLPQALVFKEVFSPKTIPGTLSSHVGKRTGRDIFYRGKVIVGIRARGFIDTVSQEWDNWTFVKAMDDVMEKIANRFNSK